MGPGLRMKASVAADVPDAASGAAATRSRSRCFRKLEEGTIASFTSTRSSRKAVVKWLETNEAPDHCAAGSQSSRSWARLAAPYPGQQPLTSASGTPVLCCGAHLHFVTPSAGTTPYVHVGSRGAPLLAVDGSVLRKGPQDAVVAPLQVPLPLYTPYLVNRCGAPYGICSLDGSAHPLAVCAVQGRAWKGPGRVPLLLMQAGVSSSSPQQQQQLVTADGAEVLGPQRQQIRVTLAPSDTSYTPEFRAVTGVVEAATGQPLRDMDGQPLTVDPITLQLQRASGQPAFDQQGQPLRLRWGTAAAPAGWPCPAWLLAVLLLVLMTALVCMDGGAVLPAGAAQLAMLLVAAAAAAAAAVGAGPAQQLERGHMLGAPSLPGPVLLDTYGNPLCDAYGQRLCVVRRTSPCGAVQECIVSCTGGPLCLRGHGHAQADGLHLGSLPLLRGGPGGDVLQDGAGEPLLGAHNQRLRVLLDSSTQQPRLSACGYPLALTQAGSPFLGPQQQPLYTTHDGALLLREDGHPLLSAEGRMLGLGPGGRLQHTDGTPCRVSGQHLHLSGCGVSRTCSTSSGDSSGGGSSSNSSSGTERSASAQRAAAGLSFGCRPVLFSSGGQALTDAQGRPVLAGPLGTHFTLTGSNAGRSQRAWGLWQLQPAVASISSSGSSSESTSGTPHTVGGRWRTALEDCHAIISITSNSNSPAHSSSGLSNDLEVTPDAAGHPLTCWDVVPMAGLNSSAHLLQLTAPHKDSHMCDAAGPTSTIMARRSSSSSSSSSSVEVPAEHVGRWTLWRVLDAVLLWCQLLLETCPLLLGVVVTTTNALAACSRYLAVQVHRCGAAVSCGSWWVLCACTAAQQPGGLCQWLLPAGAGCALAAVVGLALLHRHSSCAAWGVAELELLAQLVQDQALPAGAAAGWQHFADTCATGQVALSLWQVAHMGVAATVALAYCFGRLLPALSRCNRAPASSTLLLLCLVVVPASAAGAWLVSVAWAAAADVPAQQT